MIPELDQWLVDMIRQHRSMTTYPNDDGKHVACLRLERLGLLQRRKKRRGDRGLTWVLRPKP